MRATSDWPRGAVQWQPWKRTPGYPRHRWRNRSPAGPDVLASSLAPPNLTEFFFFTEFCVCVFAGLSSRCRLVQRRRRTSCPAWNGELQKAEYRSDETLSSIRSTFYRVLLSFTLLWFLFSLGGRGGLGLGFGVWGFWGSLRVSFMVDSGFWVWSDWTGLRGALSINYLAFVFVRWILGFSSDVDGFFMLISPGLIPIICEATLSSSKEFYRLIYKGILIKFYAPSIFWPKKMRTWLLFFDLYSHLSAFWIISNIINCYRVAWVSFCKVLPSSDGFYVVLGCPGVDQKKINKYFFMSENKRTAVPATPNLVKDSVGLCVREKYLGVGRSADGRRFGGVAALCSGEVNADWPLIGRPWLTNDTGPWGPPAPRFVARITEKVYRVFLPVPLASTVIRSHCGLDSVFFCLEILCVHVWPICDSLKMSHF